MYRYTVVVPRYIRYTNVDAWLSCRGFEPGTAPRIAAAVLLEQFAWCPLFYGLYLIPTNQLLGGNGIDAVSDAVETELPKTLIENAKVWTLANAFLYTCPVELRVPASNSIDLVWAWVLSELVAETGQGGAEGEGGTGDARAALERAVGKQSADPAGEGKKALVEVGGSRGDERVCGTKPEDQL